MKISLVFVTIFLVVLQVYSEERILSRKRRYLVFPEGSSFQVVWDGIIPIVDYTNYLILGITVALAWELPSKPPSEILEELQDKLNEGTLGLHRNDTINKIKYIDSTTTSTQNWKVPSFYAPAQTNSYYSKPQTNARPYYSKPTQKWDKYSNKNWATSNRWKYGDDWKYRPQANYTYYQNKYDSYYKGNNRNTNRRTDNRYYSNTWSANGAHWKTSNGNTLNSRPTERHHRVYPVFGKRSIPDEMNPQHRRVRRDADMDKVDKIHLRYHRSTRHDLYGRIEKYLQTRGKNGQECVLRALCETGQRGHETEPGSFVVEIMRAIFTLPENHIHDSVTHSKHRSYDEAHLYEGDCAKKFPKCKDSIWSEDFVF